VVERAGAVVTMSDSGEPRTVLITGGTRGIGLACARAFATNGDRVAVLSRSTATDEFPCYACDVADATAVNDTFGKIEAELGKVQVVVSNAGITRDTLLARMSDEDWHDVLDANLTGAFHVARRAIGPMMKARWGRLIFVSSVGAYLGAPGQTNYAATKAGLIGFARSIAREYGSRGITANVVTPGPIDTDMTNTMGDDWRERVATTVPVGRFGTSEEVAAAVRFLASAEAAFITGAVLPVDGGLAMGN
jgi:NAD(P)-dependent dehydrogenase (short-subunit alcohol dehydrogenase family)